jgi:flagellar hook protein FlgE
MDPISTARYGMMAATQQLTASANRIAAGGASGDVDYATEAVDQIQAKQAFQANVGVIKVADEMWQSLLDLQSAPKTN